MYWGSFLGLFKFAKNLNRHLHNDSRLTETWTRSETLLVHYSFWRLKVELIINLTHYHVCESKANHNEKLQLPSCNGVNKCGQIFDTCSLSILCSVVSWLRPSSILITNLILISMGIEFNDRATYIVRQVVLIAFD